MRLPSRGHGRVGLFLVGLVCWSLLGYARAGAQAVTDVGIDLGDPAAPVLVVEYADFGCSACAEFARTTFHAIEAEFVTTGLVRWRIVPFVLGPFRHSKHAAAAALCAAEQDAFWSMHDLLFENQRQWSRAGDPGPILKGFAAELGLDSARFHGCVRSDAAAERVLDFTRLARESRVRATPTFFLNDRRVLGALPLATFRELLTTAGTR